MLTIDEHMKLSKSDRQSHTDLSSPCQQAFMKINYRLSKKGDPVTSIRGQMTRATDNLKKFLKLSNSTSNQIHTCHLCVNDSSAPNGFVCVNPEHIYFGSASENYHDKSKESKNKLAASALNKGNHFSQQIKTCQYCGKSGNPGAMSRYHFEYCKHK
jgi:hypothetical protein